MTSDLSTQLSSTKMLCTLLVACCLFSFSSDVVAERSVGCLFSSELCETGEVCFDDNAFGRCHSIMDLSEDKYRHLLKPETLSLLEHEMRRLFIGGYRWIHNYTQCVIQNILYAERHHLSYDPGLCARLLQMTVPPVPAELLRELQDIEPEDMASIKFLPSISNPNSDYGDEFFIPPHSFEEEDDDDQYEMQRPKKRENSDEDYKSLIEYLQGISDEADDDNWFQDDDNIKVVKTDLSSDLNQRPIFLEGGMEWIPVDDESADWWQDISTVGNKDDKAETERPVRWLKDVDNEADSEDDGDSVEWRPLPEESANFRRHLRYDTKKPGPGYYVHEPEEEPRENKVLQSFPAWAKQLARLNSNKAGSVEAEGEQIDDEVVLRLLAQDTSPDDKQVEDDLKDKTRNSNKAVASKSINSQGFLPGEKEKSGVDDVGGQYETVDASYTYLLLQKGRTYLKSEAEKVVMKLQQLLKLPRGIFSNINVDGDQVTFKVNPNPEGLNASAVANKAEELSQELKDVTGVEIEGAGIGDKTKYEVVSKTHDRRLFVLTFILCGLIVGVVVAVAVVYLVRRHARSKEKLQSLAQPETEASQDYQDLCRQRMASKCHEKPEPIHVAQSPKRVSSLSQSEGSQPSPSSRSSTSSWSEEPVTSNMDISTGHMILSYMEDHLKNKDRLDREWEALCAYEAEPCCTATATLPQNVKKNRYPDVLPYDHSRVVLNDLSNVSGEDYINASTITDHDPRNPAYIATQGPLPHTAADFWQMVWEQGSVVVVTLTRLMENGVAMCHRYWPEEGSEVYHVYEVHLVSEHIWCDEYLVRSFYLKNLKTSETRTVTQFHFLAWPDNNVPSSTKAILEFRRKVNKSYRGRSCPIVVHCSDGTGRTGTYCLIDMVLNRMSKGAKEIDIAATLEHIRDQRGGMVKTKAQFEFVLMAIAEEVHAILKALSH